MENKVIAQYQNAPIDKSIGPVVKELSAQPVLVAIANPTGDDSVEFSVAADNQGALWIYVFTDEDELMKTFPDGSAYVEMSLEGVLETVGPDEQFGGIFINSKSTSMYVIPRAFFGFAYKLINNSQDHRAA